VIEVITEAELMFQLGAIMLLAFIAATIASKVNQSVMIGYILIGVLIGPKMSMEFFGIEYRGLIHDIGFIEVLSGIGLIMLMFFVGLEFSFTKLKRTRTPAIILAIIDTGIGLFVGFVFATYLGWPAIDSIFLAGVIAMSSTSIAMKVLYDLKRMSSPEVEFLLGLVVVETFIAMLILAVASGMIVQPDVHAVEYGRLLIGMAAFYGFFVWVAVWAVPRVVKFFSRIDNDELFILFVLGLVFLTSGVAALMNVPPIIGAFFMGMILAESKVTQRIQNKMESFRDAFVAIFFTAFGMMIDPAMFGDVMWIVIAAIGVVVVYEVLAISAISYFLGFSSRAATTIGTSMSGRGVESILYASVGSEVKGATMGAQLTPFAGAFCFGMSVLAPQLVKHSAALARALARLVPRPLKFSGALISRTLGKAVMPVTLRLFKGAKTTGAMLFTMVILCIAILAADSWVRIILAIAAALVCIGVYFAVRREVEDIVKHVNYSNIGVIRGDRNPIVNLVTWLVAGAAGSALAIVLVWPILWWIPVIVVAAYVIFVVELMLRAYGMLCDEDYEAPQKIYQMPRGEESAEDSLDLPEPVHGSARNAPRDVRF